MPGRVILHVDMDAFFASVEQRDRPELRGRPVIVGAPPDARGVVAAASYEARRYGVHSAMPSREAGRLCPHGVFVPPRGERYEEVSRQIMALLERFTPLVEPVSIDEAFLDVTGSLRRWPSGEAVAQAIKRDIRRETGLTASVGVAPSKFLAKVASDLHKPDGLTVTPFEAAAVRAFLAPLPAGRLWGVGPVTRRRLESAGLRTVGDVQTVPLETLGALVGRNAAESLAALARGEDPSEIELDRTAKSLSREHTFPEDVESAAAVEEVLGALVEDVGRALRADGRYAGRARLKLRWAGFETLTRQKAFAAPCCDDFSLRDAALDLFRPIPLVRPVRLIGFGVADLVVGPATQLSLFDADARRQARRERLSRAVDALREKFGEGAIVRPDRSSRRR